MNTALEEANLYRAYLKNAYLREAHLEKARLRGTHLEEAYLVRAHLEGANLRGAFLDSATDLAGITLGEEKLGFASLADVHWGDTNLSGISVLDWRRVRKL